jgi:serine/threonine protein kinase
VISGYRYLISIGVFHRDLKPANIMKCGNTWKIGDFGFSTICKKEYLLDSINVGTPLYMAPESLSLNKYSIKTDIFAVGIILFEMLTGNTPWECKT